MGTDTGHLGVPLALSSKGFVFPCFFPPDVFHLIYANVYPLLYRCFTTGNKAKSPESYEPGDPIFITPAQDEALGKVMQATENINCMPSCFTNRLRLIADRNSHFKMVENGQFFHYYLIPFLIEIRRSRSVPVRPLEEAMEMLQSLIEGAKMTMTQETSCTQDIKRVNAHFIKFANSWERLFIRNLEPLVC